MFKIIALLVPISSPIYEQLFELTICVCIFLFNFFANYVFGKNIETQTQTVS